MKAFKIILTDKTEKNKWHYEEQNKVRVGEVMFPYKNDEIELKKGDVVYFLDDHPREFNLDGQDYISTNPTNLICQK